MNDPKELIVDGLIEAAEKLHDVDLGPRSDNSGHTVALEVGEVIKRIYILSFSELDDQPLMWRRYGEEGAGVALKVDVAALMDIGVSNGKCRQLNLAVRCSYVENSDAESEAYIAAFCRLYSGLTEDSVDEKYARTRELLAALFVCLASRKVLVLAEEKEVRIVRIDFHEGGDIISINKQLRKVREWPESRDRIAEVKRGPYNLSDRQDFLYQELSVRKQFKLSKSRAPYC